MGLEVSARLRRIATGEVIELREFGGKYGFNCLKERVKNGEWFTPAREEIQVISAQLIDHMKKDGFTMTDFDGNYGVPGLVKLLALMDFYRSFGYEIQISVDW